MMSAQNLHIEKNTGTYPVEINNSVAYHKKLAGCLVIAAKHYLEAAKNEEAGDNKKAFESTIQAEGILLLALTFREKNNGDYN